MAIYLGSITTGVVASLISTTLIFIFGEILPQAVFPRYALAIGSNLYWVIWVFLIVLYPITAPIAWLLDKLLGKEVPMLWSKRELGEIIKLYEKKGLDIIDEDEKRIILGALSFSDMTAKDVMIPLREVFFIDAEIVIDDKILDMIWERGFGRIPVYDSRNKKVAGILYAKSLIGIVPGKKAFELCDIKNQIIVSELYKLDDLLNLLTQKKIHMAVVISVAGEFSGLVTLEDIMEEILKTELEDTKI